MCHNTLPDPMVGGLINHDLGIWKSDLVQQHFLPHEARLILGIPLSPRFPSDRVASSRPLVNSPLAVLTNYWLLRLQIVKQGPPVLNTYTSFGEEFGGYVSLTK